MTATRLTALDDPAKPHRAVYECSDGTYVKVHAVRHGPDFGPLHWRITGSHCDASGAALRLNNRPKVHSASHEVSIMSESTVDVAAALEEGRQLVVERVRIAVAHEAQLPY